MKDAMRKNNGIFFLIVVCGMLSALFMAGFSIFLGRIIDAVTSPDETLIRNIAICFLLLLAWMICSFLFDRAEMLYTNRILRSVKERLYAAIYSKEMKSYLRTTSGDYIGLFSKDMDLLADNYLISKCDIAHNVFSALICLTAIFVIDWKLGIAFVVISLVTVVLSQIPGVWMSRTTETYSKKSATYLGILEKYLGGYEQVRLLGLGKLFHKKIDEQDSSYEHARNRYLFSKSAAQHLGMAFGMLSQLLCMSLGVYLVVRGSLTVGMLISAVNLLNGVFSPLQSFVNNKNLMGTAQDIISRIDEQQIVIADKGQAIGEAIQSLELSDVSISFGEKKILDHYSVRFEKNKKYAIMGESGRGKSTIAKLIMKYYDDDAYEGNVRINGVDTRGISEDSIYEKIAYVQRSTFLIGDDVKNNILLYRENIAPDRLENVMYAMGFKDDFVLKQIDETEQTTVSYGEMQRIDMARFMLNDYDVWIFDEPTNGLDAETAQKVMQKIFALNEGIVIVITHDTSEEHLSRFDSIIRL